MTPEQRKMLEEVIRVLDAPYKDHTTFSTDALSKANGVAAGQIKWMLRDDAMNAERDLQVGCPQ